jgi:hypothetical protein
MMHDRNQGIVFCGPSKLAGICFRPVTKRDRPVVALRDRRAPRVQAIRILRR